LLRQRVKGRVSWGIWKKEWCLCYEIVSD
jgi:hypothetical protein